MENTNQKNTGNIQIAPVSAAADLNHKREGYLTWAEYFMGVAMLSGSGIFRFQGNLFRKKGHYAVCPASRNSRGYHE